MVRARMVFATPKSPAAISVICVLIASFCFTLNDLGIKFLSGDYALHQVVLIRATAGLIFTVCLLVPIDGGFAILKTRRLGLHLLRAIAIFIANMTFFVGLASLTLPVATALFFMAPLFITAMSPLFLGERIGGLRWLAVTVGLAGVLVILRPGADAFQNAAILPVIAAFAYACMQIMTRRLGITERASTMAFYIQLTFVVSSSLIGLGLGDGRYSGTGDASLDFLTREWISPETGDVIIMVLVGFMSATGGYFISQAYRMSEATFVAPFEYFAMPFTVLWSFLVFAELPDAVSWLGIVLIIGAGLFILWRETVKGREVAAKRPMPRYR